MEKDCFIRAAAAFEKEFKCRLCMHDYCGELNPLLPAYHLNPVCTMLKRKYPFAENQCILFDQMRVQQQLTREGIAFLKCCAFGLAEAVFPVFHEARLCGCMFAGPFRDSVAVRLSARKNREKIPGAIPGFPKNRETFFAFGELLASMIDTISFQWHSEPGDIRDFLRTRFMQNIALDDAAEFLGLTPARASDRIRRECGKGFSELLNEIRMENACRLLSCTAFTVVDVSERCGFRSSAYFHRVFHHAHGMTPQEYRALHQHLQS